MKAKIFGFFCSLILLSASVKGQTIDGVLYTNFNNYYKWRGGAFDSTLLIPNKVFFSVVVSSSTSGDVSIVLALPFLLL